jgi:hypothetical protein
MATFGGSNIVTDGLVLWLDAANRKSYPGSGTSWLDLSGNNNTGTLTNGPTFSSASNGSIVFDGVDDRVSINNGLGVNISNVYTVFIWVKFNSYDTVLLGSNTFNDSGYPIYVENSNNLYIATNEVGAFTFTNLANLTLNNWTYLTVVRNNRTIIWYKNGIYLDTKTLNSDNGNIIKGVGAYNNGTFRLNGNIAQTQIYNRALSAQEVRQNYDALKSRYLNIY